MLFGYAVTRQAQKLYAGPDDDQGRATNRARHSADGTLFTQIIFIVLLFISTVVLKLRLDPNFKTV
jgi:hypothetical protein